MSELTFVARGRTMTAAELEAAAPRQTKKPAPEKVRRHRGFVVTGYPPGFIEQAKRARDALLSEWRSMGVREGRPPKPWDEELFVRTTKPFRVRTKHYEVEAAAMECAALAERAGWARVQVTALVDDE